MSKCIVMDFKHFDVFNENYHITDFVDVPLGGIFRYKKAWYKKTMPTYAYMRLKDHFNNALYISFNNPTVLWLASSKVAAAIQQKEGLNL